MRAEPPRIFCIPASDAPVLAVIRRGPTEWAHVGRWDVERDEYQPGSWFRGRIYPQRCDLSPDGRWFCYFTLNGKVPGTGTEKWPHGSTYVAISRLPWLTALTAWGTCGTWTRGMHFRAPHGRLGVPYGEGKRNKFGLEYTTPATFQVERRRGWTETADTPARDANDAWDERRCDHVVMEKPRPGGRDGEYLRVQGQFAAFREGPWLTRPPTKVTDYHVGSTLLADVQWADWDARGRLLVATKDARLQIRDGDDGTTVQWEHDLAPMRPESEVPPPEASQW